jgi:hypothetical protein
MHLETCVNADLQAIPAVNRGGKDTRNHRTPASMDGEPPLPLPDVDFSTTLLIN